MTYENGRATVRGIASLAHFTNCMTASGHTVDFADVFAHRDWILETIGMTDYFLAGNTRVRVSGRASRGVMGIACFNPYGTMWGPLNVLGVQLGANCEPAQGQSVVCSLNAAQMGPTQLAITGFTMKTTCAPHGTSLESLPFTANRASYYGLAPVSPDPVGICIRELACNSPPRGLLQSRRRRVSVVGLSQTPPCFARCRDVAFVGSIVLIKCAQVPTFFPSARRVATFSLRRSVS